MTDSDPSASNVPLQWGTATIVWSKDGYLLTVPMYLDERAVAGLQTVMGSLPLGNAVWGLVPAVWTRSKGGTSVQPGSLTLRSPRLLELNPLELRIKLNNAANTARGQAVEDETTDTGRIAAFIETLRKT